MSNTKDIHPLVIIGSGPAGLTAAVYAARSNLNPVVIDGSTPGGQLMGTTYVENWPGEKSILGPTLMINMREHAKHFGTTFVEEEVVRADLTSRPFTLWTNRDSKIMAHSLIIATGATPNRLNCPGEDTYWGKGITTCTVCDGAFYKNKPVLVVGGGDSAMEGASFLKKFTDDITVVHILEELTASYSMQKRVVDDPTIKIIYQSTVTNITGDGTHVTGATITHQKSKVQEERSFDGIFIAIGLKPNTQPFRGQLAMNDLGYLMITNNTRTSIDGVFAAGDVYDYRYKQAITSAGAGCMATMDVEQYLKTVL